MKTKLISLICLLALLPSLAFGQASAYVRNDAATTTIQNTNLQPSRAATDNKGRVFVSSAVTSVVPGTAATSLGKAEDAVHASGDVGVLALGVANQSLATFAANGDNTPIGTSVTGSVYGIIDAGSQTSNQNGILKPEDLASANGDAGVAVYSVRENTLTVSTNLSGDYQSLKSDILGRLVVTPAPAGETWSACSASNTGTSDTLIKTTGGATTLYVTSISCYNTAAVASSIIFKESATQIYAGGIGNSTLNGVATWAHTLPIPLRLVTTGVFNFAMGTTATATTCCAAGYTSVN